MIIDCFSYQNRPNRPGCTSSVPWALNYNQLPKSRNIHHKNQAIVKNRQNSLLAVDDTFLISCPWLQYTFLSLCRGLINCWQAHFDYPSAVLSKVQETRPGAEKLRHLSCQFWVMFMNWHDYFYFCPVKLYNKISLLQNKIRDRMGGVNIITYSLQQINRFQRGCPSTSYETFEIMPHKCKVS